MQTYETGTVVRVNVTFLNEDGDPTDPTTVVLEARSPSGIVATVPTTNDGVGVYHGLIPTAENGTWWVQWTGSGDVEAVIEDAFAIVPSHVDAPAAPQVGGGIQLGPCTTWATAADVMSCCAGASDAPPDLLETFALEASEVLFALSGRRFKGVCGETVRPCATTGCGLQALGVGIIPGWGGFGGYGYGWDGAWGWWTDNGIGSAGLVCGCNALSEIVLGYPVNEVVEVKIDGVALDPSEYRVDEWRYLVRNDDPATGLQRFWPSCQRLGVESDDEPGTWSVTYTFGVAPPVSGMLAAGQLACQMWQQCEGLGCTLPVGTTKVIRQGVQIERGILANWLVSEQGKRGWATGLVHVDAFLNAFNPNGLQRRPTVWTPDVPMRPRRVGT